MGAGQLVQVQCAGLQSGLLNTYTVKSSAAVRCGRERTAAAAARGVSPRSTRSLALVTAH